MKIAIEANALFRKNKSGVPQYATNLFRALFDIDKGNEYTLVNLQTKLSDLSPPFPLGGNVSVRNAWKPPGMILNPLLITGAVVPLDTMAGTYPDLWIFPDFVRWPLLKRSRSIVFIHDLTFLEHPEFLTPRHRFFLAKIVPKSINKSDHIVTISENTKRVIIKNYETPGSKITVINPAIDHKIYKPLSPRKIAQARKKYKLPEKYLLYLGTLEPRKNIVGIVESYLLLPAAIRKEYILVLAGGKGWLDDEINRVIKKAGRQVRVTGYVDEADKPAIYCGATLFLYPSHYEGWGMQILESMACGTPVITVRNSSLPEVGGKAAIYIRDENDHPEISKTVEGLINSPNELERLSKLCFAKARNFSWSKSAKKLLELIKSV